MTELQEHREKAKALNTLLDIAIKAMHENANLGTEEGLEEAEKIRDAIFEVKAADFPQAVRSWRTYERREERRKAKSEANRKHRSELIKLMAKG